MKSGFFRLEPELPGLEFDYRRYHLHADIHQVIIGISLWILPYLSFALSDYFLIEIRPIFWRVFILRLAYVLFCIGVVLLLKYRVRQVTGFDQLMLTWACVTVAWNVMSDLLLSVNTLSGLLISLVGVYSIYFFVPNPFLIRVLPPLIFSLYVMDRALTSNPDGGLASVQAVVMAFLITNLVGIVFSVRMQNQRRKTFLTRLEEEKIRAELTRLASTDPLTGVLNRRRLLELAGESFYRFRRYQRPFTIMVMDLDGFKQVNDTFGHLEGDSVLIRFAEAVQAMKRESDALGRMGGDEFCLVLPETLPPAAAVMAERILKLTGDILTTDGQQSVPVTVSIGVSQVRPDDATLDLLYARADSALYKAKHYLRFCSQSSISALDQQLRIDCGPTQARRATEKP